MEKAKRNREEMTATLLDLFPTEFLQLNTGEQVVSLQLYRLLAEGQPVSPDQIAQTLKLSNDTVKGILKAWHGVYYDEDDRIIGYWGLALPEMEQMEHRFFVNGQTLYTWCALDSLFIPQLLQKTAHVESTCPVTGAQIRLTVTPNGIERFSPSGAVMSLVAPQANQIRENVIRNFCHYIYFFSSAEAGSKWVKENEGTFLLSIDEAYALGRKINEARYKETLFRIL